MTDTAFLVEPGWTRSVCLRSVPRGLAPRVLFYADGAARIEHKCRTIDDTLLVVAPALRLGDGHTITCDDPLTVTPSVLCPDCGLHGFITAGRWIDA